MNSSADSDQRKQTVDVKNALRHKVSGSYQSM